MEALIDDQVLADELPQFELSFRPFLQYLNEQRRNASSAIMDQFYAHLIDQFEEAVVQTNRPTYIKSPSRLADYFRLATVAVLPLVGTDPNIAYAFGLPVPLRLYHCSPAFEQLLHQFPNLTAQTNREHNLREKQRFLYRLVLERCYHVVLASSTGPSFRFDQSIGGLTKYYQMAVNISFVEPHSAIPLPPLQSAWVDFAVSGASLPADVDPLPLHEFVFEGFSFFRVDDVTREESIQQLKEVFVRLSLANEPSAYRQFETAFRNLCGQAGLEIGIVSLPQVNGRYVYLPDNQQRSVLLRLTDGSLDNHAESEIEQVLDKLLRHPQTQIFTKLTDLPNADYQALVRKGIQSFLLYPIVAGNRILGLLEMASPEANAFTPVIFDQIQRIMPLIQGLLRHQLRIFEERLEQRIKSRFTPLQPTVEWKFYEAAWEEMRREQSEPEVNLPVQFPRVYPLYGAIDVRGSSTARQKAIRQDLHDQLTQVETLLSRTHEPADPARPNRLMRANAHWQSQLADGPTPDQEQGILQFLSDTVHPFFRELRNQNIVLKSDLLDYFARTHPETGQFRQALTAYDQTMDQLNTTINAYIDQQETRLQTLFPHYFERYRTDGTEYTIYVGQSIAPDQPYGPDTRLRLYRWQVASMVEVAQLTHRLRAELPLPLQTTQLILSHNYPVDISFRRDERRFDVEGSYSIRYEVLKKRIDKVQILGTQERLTQPDMIALVYSHSSEVANYLPFITELQATGQLLPDVEYVDLEPVQGVANLKALRVRIAYDD